MFPQRDEWIAKATTRGKFPFACNGDESFPVHIIGQTTSARLAPGGQSLLDVHVKLPPLDGLPSPCRGLTALKLPEKARTPEIPHLLRWLNYWPAAAAQAIRLPLDSRRRAAFASAAHGSEAGGPLARTAGTVTSLLGERRGEGAPASPRGSGEPVLGHRSVGRWRRDCRAHARHAPPGQDSDRPRESRRLTKADPGDAPPGRRGDSARPWCAPGRASPAHALKP